MKSQKLTTRVQLLIASFIIAVVATGFTGWYQLDKINTALQTVYTDRAVPLGQLARVAQRMEANRALLMAAALKAEPAAVPAAVTQVRANMEGITQDWKAYTATKFTAEEKALADEYAARRAEYVEKGLKASIALLEAGKFDEAKANLLGPATTLLAAGTGAMNRLLDLQLNESKREYETSQTAERVAVVVLASLALGGLVVALLQGWTLTRFIRRALGAEPETVRQAVLAVANGDLNADIPARSDDNESLMATMVTMRDSLRRTVGAVRGSAEGVATASAQIAQGNQDLSARTESQASALQETAATMDELGTTVRNNADNAKQANQLALGASSVAVKGGEVVGQVVETMKAINDSSKKIADIITVIDGIAFQTNILALNAAVEAARAGEQGRGFAVVAGEVRSLAQRSADAAKEIKSLITTSVDRVDQGTQLVDEAGRTMEEIVSAIKRVTDIVGEISAASSEQSLGVSQVGEAITQMDQATQQNAALVEESAAAAESLRQQASDLVKAVAVFRIGADAGGRDFGTPARADTHKSGMRSTSGPRPAPAARQDGPTPAASPVTTPASTGKDDDWESF